MKRLALILLLLPAAAWAGGWPDAWPDAWLEWWLSPDQQGWRLAQQGEYRRAAELFEDPWHKGAAYYRAGDFEQAAAVWGRLRGPEAAYNRGTALILLGQYEAAIAALEIALEQRPAWAAAAQNLDIAVARKARLAPLEDDAGGTGGQLGADEIVFDDTGRVDRGGTEAETEGGAALSDDELRAVWLRRVQADPADFLRARFSYQLYRQQQEPGDDTPR